MHSKTYEEHLRNAGYCGSQWRILTLSPLCDQHAAETLPKIRIVRTRCNSKACPMCALRSYRKIRASLRRAAINNKWRMFTLTIKKTSNNSSEDLHHLENSFRELRKKLKRNNPDFKYFAVRELAPSGMWHIHGLWNIYIPIRELSYEWARISGAYRVYLSQVRRPLSAINYIFKYCFKSIHNDDERRTLYEQDKRKFSSSKGLLVKNKNSNPYVAEFGVEYGTDELKTELYNIIRNSRYSVDDFGSVDYPYFDDLVLNLFHKFTNEHPPNLFGEHI